ncbi:MULTISPECIES: AbrB/MazE/SpoVT family DNA-binding domain-containing protein [unclassified Kaistella]|uniref:AbrB/MazE/SpoVT family DNA-binding domain-containing protein n=1 Tax=unclassified Kaistella TaxID=2762626 RepID=UPI0027354DB2|nr:MULTISPECIES: AbrB/MazE/SpoVT family DNA-binding domain-containing protein [unclassified Kaistella]MCZ2085678.1 AbrB/MazE/SpoVT family DNA-binding domain-containing protein [Flavobacteriales bacterium]MDP2453151.1 AbrB/MazE/SpoVT family DNA-binding domain-containing protein [Kaistella sp. SH11-4b]MDP2456208.1 AbrB/MazE/SpoVT family DNA-binding domain-containing protein [Kaistella sp. SH40-3]MDP2458964.1 AbrB/MazE/SpoVT family DNA-binding domain-containing protein [Kaistella sp. SH19-2b]
MKTKLRKIGNSSGIILSKRILEQLDIEDEDELQLVVEDGKILIEKVSDVRTNWKEQFLQAGSLKDNDHEMTFSNQFDEEEWTW